MAAICCTTLQSYNKSTKQGNDVDMKWTIKHKLSYWCVCLKQVFLENICRAMALSDVLLNTCDTYMEIICNYEIVYSFLSQMINECFCSSIEVSFPAIRLRLFLQHNFRSFWDCQYKPILSEDVCCTISGWQWCGGMALQGSGCTVMTAYGGRKSSSGSLTTVYWVHSTSQSISLAYNNYPMRCSWGTAIAAGI